MLRYVVGSLVCLVLVGGVAIGQGQPKKKATVVAMGTFVSYEDGNLTMRSGGKARKGRERKFEISEDVKVWVYTGWEKRREKPKESQKRDALKDVKEKTNISLLLIEKKVTDVYVNPPGGKPDF